MKATTKTTQELIDHREHMLAWGCPEEYAGRVYPPLALDHPQRERDLRRAVAEAATWYPEQSRALAEMIRRGDVVAIRGWDRDALVDIGDDRGKGEGDTYADEVLAALHELADVVRARVIEETQRLIDLAAAGLPTPVPVMIYWDDQDPDDEGGGAAYRIGSGDTTESGPLDFKRWSDERGGVGIDGRPHYSAYFRGPDGAYGGYLGPDCDGVYPDFEVR